MTSPCYGCEERHPRCHADCERYREWAESRQKAHEVDTYTAAHVEKIRKYLRKEAQNRADGRRKGHGGD